MSTQTISSPESILAAWRNAREQRRLRNRDIAHELGISEAALVASACGNGVTRLRADGPELLRAFERLGPVKALTRNEHAVIETEGVYRNVEEFGAMGQVLGDGIDLRAFYTRWGSAFAVRENTRRGESRSFQFFTPWGGAVHKVFLTHPSDVAEYDAITAEFVHEDQSCGHEVAPSEGRAPERADREVDSMALRQAWLALEDTHDFHRVLRSAGVSRTQAFRLAGTDLAWRVSRHAVLQLLQRVAVAELGIMIFVGNPGMTQIYSGTIRRVVQTPPWCNVLDPGFNLHVRERGVAQAWIVRKPTRNGIITALELYDDDGQQITLIVSKRATGTEETGAWRGIVTTLSRDLA